MIFMNGMFAIAGSALHFWSLFRESFNLDLKFSWYGASNMDLAQKLGKA